MLGPANQADIQRYVGDFVWMGDTLTYTHAYTQPVGTGRGMPAALLPRLVLVC